MNTDDLIIVGGAALAGYLGATTSYGSLFNDVKSKLVSPSIDAMKATLENESLIINDRLDDIEKVLKPKIQDVFEMTGFCGIIDNYKVSDRLMGARIYIRVKNKQTVPLRVYCTGFRFQIGDVQSYAISLYDWQSSHVIESNAERWIMIYGLDGEPIFPKGTIRPYLKDRFGSEFTSNKIVDASISLKLHCMNQELGSNIDAAYQSYTNFAGEILCMKYLSNRSTGFSELKDAGLIK